MRRATIAALTALLLAMCAPALPVAAASNAKVVVVVGPVGSKNDHYKSDANDVVAEARRYTSNVVKVYTPNATWARVKAAAQGASVFVYLGHGNGWPSIYPPFQTLTKDGLGLDPSTGADGSKHVYYGEDYIRDNIRFAPNAVVLLYHLCYASGNTEPGLSQGTFTEARQRVDNYGAGFIGAGARAVIAEGHPAHPVVNAIRQLFATDRTMDQVFRSAPTWHGHLRGPYASQRTPGLRYEMDPDTATPSGFYRSIVGDLSLRASAVTRSTLVPTGTHPTEFVVPGAAEVVADAGTGLFTSAATAQDPAANATITLPLSTRLRLTGEEAPAADGTRVFAASVLGGTATGFVRAGGLAPRDSTATVAWSIDHSGPLLSPNADNSNDGLAVAVRFSEPVSASFVVRNAAGKIVRSQAATNDIARFAWDLRDSSGNVVPDGDYTWAFRGRDGWGNPGVNGSGSFTLDATAPVSKAVATSTAGLSGWIVSPVQVTLSAKDALSGVKAISYRIDGGSTKTYTDPVTISGNGSRLLEYRATDKAGIREAWRKVTFRIDTQPPVISIGLAGTAGDAPGTWRGPVTVTPAFSDAASGVAGRLVAVDGAGATALGTTAVLVDGDGDHTVAFTATDVAGNASTKAVAFRIDTVAPVLELPPVDGIAGTVTPNADGRTETVTLPFTTSEAGTVNAVVTAPDATVVRTLAVPAGAGAGSIAWDGRTAAGAALPDGRYLVTLAARDAAGNASEPATREVDVYAALAAVARTPSVFFPQDGDRLAARTTVSFRLQSPAQVTVRVVDASGAVVRTAYADRALPGGNVSWAWNGKRDDGAWAKRGAYRLVVTATNGIQAATQAVGVTADAFVLTTSVRTAVRGKALTVTARTAEPLSTTPAVIVRQPGLDPWKVTMTRVSSTVWKATVKPRTSGDAGTLSLTVRARDTGGGTNASVVKLALR